MCTLCRAAHTICTESVVDYLRFLLDEKEIAASSLWPRSSVLKRYAKEAHGVDLDHAALDDFCRRAVCFPLPRVPLLGGMI